MILKIICGLIYCPILGLRIGPPPITPCNLVLFTERGNLKAVFCPMGAELTPGTNHISFDAEALTELDAIVVEIQDAGARYFNYTKDVFHLMVILAVMENPPSLYIVDHINPAGRIVEGSMPSGTVEPHTPKIAHRHGLTLGELCDLWYNEIGATFALHVISALASDSTRQLLPWTIAPASDIPGMFTCEMYSGGGLWNNTTITPAIGTARPYEYLGAPFIRHNRRPRRSPDAPLHLHPVHRTLRRPTMQRLPDHAPTRYGIPFTAPHASVDAIFPGKILAVRAA